MDISIHAARMGCDCSSRYGSVITSPFQSTQPEWAATVNSLKLCQWRFVFQSTQHKRAATLLRGYAAAEHGIPIHAAQEGCDPQWSYSGRIYTVFQSTQPKRAATMSYLLLKLSQFQFQSTQPKRAATVAVLQVDRQDEFQSTQPKRAATSFLYQCVLNGSTFQSTQPKRAATKY